MVVYVAIDVFNAYMVALRFLIYWSSLEEIFFLTIFKKCLFF